MRILVLSEASFLKSGYAIYTSNLLQRLQKDGHTVAELGVYSQDAENRIKDVPWIFYSNLPSEKEKTLYAKDGSNHYGKFRFESTVCDFKPHIVITVRDPFMDDFIYYSPLRETYHWMTMAPVDGVPQQPQWLDIFKNADTLFTYTDWGRDHLKEYGINSITASPAASSHYFPYKQSEKIKEVFGFSGKKIIGSILRNQPRKLFETLIAGFSEYIKKYNNNNVLLYMHTAMPDVGFNIPRLLLEHNVISKTLFTYSCVKCNSHFPMFFSDYVTWCPKCKTKTLKTPDIYNSVSEIHLNKIINMFDIYVQPASREGFGMPQAEAAACGIPIITTPYAGMVDIVNKIHDCGAMEIGGYKLQHAMHMYEAVPTPSSLADQINKYIDSKEKNQDKIRESFESNYSSWDTVYSIWKNEIDLVDWQKIENKQKQKFPINNEFGINKNQNYAEFAKELIINFAGERFLNSYLHYRLIRDLNQGFTLQDPDNYIVQHFDGQNYYPFSKEIALEYMYRIAERRLTWQKEWNEGIIHSS